MDDLVKYRLDSAEDKLKSSKLLLDNGQYKDSIGRSYYALFTAVRAVLALEGVDYAKHSGVISHFQREYIKPGLFDAKYSKYLQRAFQIRNACDYDDFYLVSKEDAEEQYDHAREMVSIIREFLNDKAE